MPYRGMTENELQTFVHEFRAFQAWRAYVTFACDIYGPRAERIEVITAAERSSAGSSLVIDSINVYDARRRPLEADLSTPWWQATFVEHFPDEELYDDEIHDDWLATMISERRDALLVPTGRFELFLASRPPRRHYTTVYVEERTFAPA